MQICLKKDSCLYSILAGQMSIFLMTLTLLKTPSTYWKQQLSLYVKFSSTSLSQLNIIYLLTLPLPSVEISRYFPEDGAINEINLKQAPAVPAAAYFFKLISFRDLSVTYGGAGNPPANPGRRRRRRTSDLINLGQIFNLFNVGHTRMYSVWPPSPKKYE